MLREPHVSHIALQTSGNGTGSKRPALVELSKLPLFPAAALQLLRISMESETATEQYEDVFKSDLGLAAELLLVVNSAAFGGRSRIDSIRHSIAYLGLERVKALADTIAFCFYVRKAPRIEYVRQIWSHAVATAILTEKIGSLQGRPNGYTAGLLHDLGRLVILNVAGPEYARELSDNFAGIESANRLESARFGLTHCEAGDAIARQWGFPDTLRHCIANHHRGFEGAANELDDVRLACRMAETLGYPELPNCQLGPSTAAELKAHSRFDQQELLREIASRIAMLET
jgi:HD-like signal output (HDOD) protein